MWRSVHSWIGLALSLLVMVTAITGALLATEPVYDRVTVNSGADDLSVADLLRHIGEANPRAIGERITRSEAGDWKLTYNERGRRRERVVDPETGDFARERKRPKFYTFLRDLHRSFLLGDDGRLLTALSGIAMTVLMASGIALLIRRMGGLRQVFAPIQGRDAGGLHSWTGRLTLVPLLIISLTALYLSALTFDILPAGSGRAPAYPESLEELDPVAPWDLHGLQAMPLSSVDEIVYPIPEDWFDVWAVKTGAAWVFYDQFTGDELSRDPLPTASRIYDFIMLLHTAKGAWPWAIVLMLASAAVPFFAVTGALVWWRGKRSGRGRIRGNAASGQAEALILVGSEGGTTWGFAKALHRAMTEAGTPTRVAAMSELRRSYPRLTTLIVMAATYGDGDAPKSAAKFLSRVGQFQPPAGLRHATLAFGDKAFPAYCAYAQTAAAAMERQIGPAALPLFEIDKQSVQAFQHWCGELSDVLGTPLAVQYEPRRPRTRRLTLTRRAVFGVTLDATTAVLRFQGKRLPFHRPGDLAQVYPPACNVPRLYSLGSSSRRDGFLEIVVKRVDGGRCSSWLCGLEEGDEIDVAIARNDRFQMPQKRPVIMVGAGTGIAPFTGMIRHNTGCRAVDLFWGGRDPQADALYADDIAGWAQSGHLARFAPAWSRSGERREYVQDRLRAERSHLIERLKAGATIMVCGGTAMAAAVRAEFDALAAECGLSLDELKRRNRYLEDIY
ncbi:MAG: N-acetylglucosamine transferase [Rhodobacterales bacterium]|nr:MAG: N-acetylglucosamine transferase [Rhodobacterales bacterium]